VRETILARRIALCTGKHARPNIPSIPTDGSVDLLHSSQIPDFERVKGKRVAVLGAGASSLDLCLNTLLAGPLGQVEWIMREPKHFSGMHYRTLVLLYVAQLLLGPLANIVINVVLNVLMYTTHLFSGTISWLPAKPLDIRYTQHIPDRAELLQSKNRKRLNRHVGCEVVEVRNKALHLSNGTVLEDIDYLLMGTGYTLPLRPENFEKPKLFATLLSTGKYRGRLYVLGEDFLDTTGATPAVCLSSAFLRAIMDDPTKLMEEQQWPMDPGRKLNSLDVVAACAAMNRKELPFMWWRIRMACVFLYYRLVHRTTIFGDHDKVIPLGSNLDDMEPKDQLTVVITSPTHAQ